MENKQHNRHPTVSPSGSLIYPIRYPRPPTRYFCRADSFAIHGLPHVVPRPAASRACFLLPSPNTVAAALPPPSTSLLPSNAHAEHAALVCRGDVTFPPPLCFPIAAAARAEFVTSSLPRFNSSRREQLL